MAALAPTDIETWTVAPGLTYEEWTQPEPQGPVRIRMLTAKLNQPGLLLDRVGAASVRDVAPLSSLVVADHDLAGVNADFFDIADTGAALGVGVDRDRGLIHAPSTGWNLSFVLDKNGTTRIEQLNLVGSVTRGTTKVASLGGVNVPHVRLDTVNAYTQAWGRAAVAGVVDGAARVRVVQVVSGVVKSNVTGASFTSTQPVTGTLLIGRGSGAITLRSLQVGDQVKLSYGLSDAAVRVAVSGSAQLLKNSQLATTDNGELHPRTAVGIDADHKQIHLIVADGRSETSTGLTLVQLAELMLSRGDENALNLDGGGSSTLVAPDATGVTGVRNTPSDGQERPIPEGLVFRYSKP
jgi:hypothetical protein